LIGDKPIGEKPEQKYPRPKTAFSPFSFDKKSTCDNQNDRNRQRHCQKTQKLGKVEEHGAKKR
jgi:hypothetical protein